MDQDFPNDALDEGQHPGALVAQLEAILGSVADGVLVYDRDGRILRWNAAAREILGYDEAERAATAAERVDSGPYEWLSADGRPLDPDESPAIRAARWGETHRAVVLRMRSSEGERWLSVTAAPLVFAGERSGAVVTLADVSDRKRGEEAQARLAAIVESTDDAVISKDLQGRIRSWNAAAERLLGYRAEEVIGRFVHLIIPPERRDEEDGILAEIQAGRRVERFDTQRVRKDGVRLDVSVVVSPVRDGAGRIVGASKIIRDVTPLRRSEVALREALASAELERTRLRAVLDALPAGVAIADATGRIVQFNDANCRIWGGPPIPQTGQDPPERRGWWARSGAPVAPGDWAMARALATGEPVVPGDIVEIEKLDGSGRATIVNAAAPIRSADGAVMGGVVAQVDITAQIRAEEALRRANEQLRDADRRKDEFLGMLSHELRNPLAPIRNALYILERSEPSGQQARRATDVANRQLRHLTRLVDDLLDVTRIARGKIELQREELDLVALARRTAEDLGALMRDRGLELALEVPRHPVLVSGDETRLRQVLGNLLNNGAKFTPAGGRVTLAVRAHQANAVVCVRDTGAGIAPELLEKVFEPFTQAKQTLARSEGGLGLGLALVRGLVALHGGAVTAVSAGPGRGAEFVVTLPLTATAGARDREGPAAAGAGAPAAGPPRRVLVVDDNRDAAETLAQLVELLGHEAMVAYDGPSAVAMARAHAPDLVLCDVGLPGIDGYEVARRLRAGGPSGLRLVAVSGYAQPEDVRAAEDAGFDRHVAKPPDPAEIERLLT